MTEKIWEPLLLAKTYPAFQWSKWQIRLEEFINLPNTWEEPAKQKGAVALDEGGEEGEDAVDGERDEERLPTAYPVSESPPEESPNHHPEIYNQTCGESGGKETATDGNAKCKCLLK